MKDITEIIKLRSLEIQKNSKLIFFAKTNQYIYDFSDLINYVENQNSTFLSNQIIQIKLHPFNSKNNISKIKADINLQKEIDFNLKNKEELINKENIKRENLFKNLQKIYFFNLDSIHEEGENKLFITSFLLEGKIDDVFVRAPLILFEVNFKFDESKKVVNILIDKRPIHNIPLLSLIFNKRNIVIDSFLFDNFLSSEKPDVKSILKELIEKYNELNINLLNGNKNSNTLNNWYKLNELKNIPSYSQKSLVIDKDSDTQLNVIKSSLLGIFSINETYIFNDIKEILDDKSWIKNFLNIDRKMDRTFNIDKYYENFDESQFLLFNELDLYQQLATKLSLEKTPVVIQGPPGTGKTQTIINIILNIINMDKRVLVVSEKQVALDVIYNRLFDKDVNLQISTLNLSLKNDYYRFFEKFQNIDKALEIKLENVKEKKLNYDKELKFVDKISNLSNKKYNGFKYSDLYKYVDTYIENPLYKIKKYDLETFINNFDHYFNDLLWISKYSKIKEWEKRLKYDLNYDLINRVANYDTKILNHLAHNYIKVDYWDEKKFPIQKKNGNLKLKNSLFKKRKTLIDKSDVLQHLKTEISYFKKNNFGGFDFQKYDSSEKEIMNILYENNYKKEDREEILNYFKKLNLVNSFNNELKSLSESLIKFNKNLNQISNKKEEIYLNNLKYLNQKVGVNLLNNYKNNQVILNKLLKQTYNKNKKSASYWIKYNWKNINKLFPIVIGTIEDVSEFIPFKEKYDYVIFDEASQIFFEKALPSIYRAKNVILFGDNKQLKPSNYFKTRNYFDENDLYENDYLDTLNADSILDFYEKNTKYKIMLKGHYRSNFSELIQFSNKEFYKNELWFENSANPYKKPIEVIDVNGVWQDKKNKAEAEKVLEVLEKLLSNRNIYKEKTIGIITFNIKQKELIKDYLYNRGSRNLKTYINIENSLNRFFIKNVEEVQGDERDIIIFSVGYSKSVRNYGPLSIDGGENRINVIATRAKDKVIIIKSHNSTEYYGSISKQRGPRKFISYLSYAEEISKQDKIYDKNFMINNSDRDWIVDVAFYLTGKIGPNYSIQRYSQKREEKLSIDLVILKNDYPVMGIICQEDKYFNEFQKREKYIFKQEFLKSRGWKVYRLNKYAWKGDKKKFLLEIRQILNNNDN